MAIKEYSAFPQSSRITEASPSDCFVSYPGHSSEESYFCAEMQSVYSAALPDWAGTLYSTVILKPEVPSNATQATSQSLHNRLLCTKFISYIYIYIYIYRYKVVFIAGFSLEFDFLVVIVLNLSK